MTCCLCRNEQQWCTDSQIYFPIHGSNRTAWVCAMYHSWWFVGELKFYWSRQSFPSYPSGWWGHDYGLIITRPHWSGTRGCFTKMYWRVHTHKPTYTHQLRNGATSIIHIITNVSRHFWWSQRNPWVMDEFRIQNSLIYSSSIWYLPSRSAWGSDIDSQ